MPVTGADLLAQISGRAVHRSSDGRDWLRAGGTFADVTAQVTELHAHGLVRLHRNVEGWWGLWRLTGAGEALVRPRAPARGSVPRVAHEPVDPARVLDLYDQGFGIEKIRRALSAPREQVRRVLLANDREIRQPGRPPVTERASS